MKNVFVIFVFALLSVSCASTPETHYYRVTSLTEPREPSGEVVIGVEPFASDSAYDSQRIIYRKSDFRLDYYHYHRWASPPGIMLADFVREELESSGRFSAVLSEFTADVNAMVGGRIIRFEEVDVTDDRWVARIKLGLFLRDAETGQLIWSQTEDVQEDLKEQSPEGLAQAASVALTRIIAANIDEIERAAAKARALQTGRGLD